MPPPTFRRKRGGTSRRRCWGGAFWRYGPAVGQVFAGPLLEGFEVEVDHGSDEKGQQLRDDQSTHHGQTERSPRLTARAIAEGDGERAHQGSHGCHHNGT